MMRMDSICQLGDVSQRQCRLWLSTTEVNMEDADKTKLITQLNDQFRSTFIGGSVLITDGVQSFGPDFVREALASVRRQNLSDT